MNVNVQKNEMNENIQIVKQGTTQMTIAYFIQTLMNMYNLYVAILLYLDGQLGYFITYITFISILKIIILSHRICTHYSFYYCFLGIFDLEFILIFFTKYTTQSEKDVDQSTQHWTIFFQFLFQQFLFFYCFGVLENSGINQYVIACQYLNYVILTLNLAIVSFATDYFEFSTKKIIVVVLIIKLFLYSYSFTIISLTYFQDNNGVNLGYYCLALIPINQVLLMIIYFFTRNILGFMQFQGMFIAVTLFNFMVKYTNRLEYIIGNIFSFFNTLVKFILLLKFGIIHLDEFLESQQNAFYGKIKYSITIIALLYSLICMVFQLLQVLLFFIKSRSYKISTTKDFDAVIDKLMKNNRYIKAYRIYFLLNQKSFSKKQNNDTQVILFWKLISIQIQKKNIIRIKQKRGSKLKMNSDILIEVENIHESLLSQLYDQIQKLQSIDYLIIKRLQNGIINKDTMYLIERENVRNKKLITNMISHTLQINSFYKHLPSLMMNNSAAILYDLYSELQIENEEQKFKQLNLQNS